MRASLLVFCVIVSVASGERLWCLFFLSSHFPSWKTISGVRLQLRSPWLVPEQRVCVQHGLHGRRLLHLADGHFAQLSAGATRSFTFFLFFSFFSLFPLCLACRLARRRESDAHRGIGSSVPCVKTDNVSRSQKLTVLLPTDGPAAGDQGVALLPSAGHWCGWIAGASEPVGQLWRRGFVCQKGFHSVSLGFFAARGDWTALLLA